MTQNSRFLKRQLYTLNQTEEGYTINPPVHRGLVLSGGGAKGIAYAGMIKAMHERDFIKNMTHVTGSSAGAMTASLIAIGMDHTNISKIINELNLITCLDNKGWRIRAVGERVRNVLEIIYMHQIKSHMQNVEVPKSEDDLFNYQLIKQKIRMYEATLEKEGIQINTLDDIIAIGKSVEKLENLDNAFLLLNKKITGQDGKNLESPRVTFADLGKLRSIMPEDQKHLIKNLSVATTNQTRSKVEFYSEDYHAEESIAEKVQHSGAHPLLFTPMQNEKGEYIADGGILDNMPTLALEKAGLEQEEILCVCIETTDAFEARVRMATKNAREGVSRVGYGVDLVAEQVFGGQILKADARVYNREKAFHHIGNMLFLNAGSITTTTIDPTPEQKKIAIENGYTQCNELLDGQKKTFNNPLIAMLFLGVEHLDAMILDDEDPELVTSAAFAKSIFFLQDTLAETLIDQKFECVEDYIKQIEDILSSDAQLNEIQKKQAMALCLKQVDFITEGELEKYIILQITEKENANKVSWFTQLLDLLQAAINWILDLFPCCRSEDENNSEKKIIEEDAANQEPQKIISPSRLFSLFFYKDIPEANSENIEIDPEDSINATNPVL